MTYKAGLWRAGPLSWCPGIVSHVDARTGITLSATMRSNLGGPAATLGGGSLVQGIPVWARVTTAGLVGAGAKVDLSGNSGRFRTLEAVAGAGMAVPDSNLLATFTGTLLANDIYQAVVASLTDSLGHVWAPQSVGRSLALGVQGGAGTGQRDSFGWNNFGAGLSGIPILSASQCLMTNVSDVGSTVFTGLGKQWTILCGARFTGGLTIAAQSVLAGGNIGADTNNFWNLGITNTPLFQFSCRAAGATAFTITQTMGTSPNHSPFVLAVRYDGTNFSLWRNGVRIAADVAVALPTITWPIVGLAGRQRRTATPIIDSEMNGNLIFGTFISRAISDAEMYELSQLNMGFYGIPEPVTNAKIVLIGDSTLTPANNNNWGPQAKWAVDAQATGSLEIPNVSNLAQSGNTFSAVTGALSAAQLAAQAAQFDGAATINAIFNGLGTNDLGPNPTPGDLATLIANAATWYTTTQGQGWSPTKIGFVLPWLNGIPPSSDYLAARVAYGAALRAMVPNPRQVIDPVAFNPSGTPGDGVYYVDDKHPTSNGSQCAVAPVSELWNFFARGA